MRSDTTNLNFSSGNRLEIEFHDIVRQRYPQEAITLSSDEPPSRNRCFKTALQRVSRCLIDFVTGQSSLSIRVQQPSAGNSTTEAPSWVVYDPSTSTQLTFLSEQAVRIWLENKHRESTIR